MLRVAFRTAAFRATAKPTLTPAFVRMSSSKPGEPLAALDRSGDHHVKWTGHRADMEEWLPAQLT